MSKYDIKDNIDKIIFRIYNLFSSFVFLLRTKERKLIKKNIRFKDIHKGKRCFILGTGPSINALTNYQVEQLRKEIVFGVNSLYKSEKVKDIVPTYYALFDNLYWGEWSYTFQDIIKKYSSQSLQFLTDYRAANILEQMGLKEESIFLYSKKYPINKINNDISTNMDISQNVVSSCILAAMFLGFKEIYLLGCDYNSFAHLQETHCYDDSEEVIDIENRLGYLLKFYSITTEIHYLIAKLAKKNGVEIINITESSLLDAYPKKNVDIVLSKELQID